MSLGEVRLGPRFVHAYLGWGCAEDFFVFLIAMYMCVSPGICCEDVFCVMCMWEEGECSKYIQTYNVYMVKYPVKDV